MPTTSAGAWNPLAPSAPTSGQPNLGYGDQSAATIDQVNIWMRSTPWYQNQMRAWGQDPGHPHLTGDQSQQILKMAQANGVVVDQSNMEIDDRGNFDPKGHLLRNTIIVAGVAAATIATMGAAGVFAGAAGAGEGAAAAGAGAGAASAGGGALASTAIGSGYIGGIAGGAGLAGGAGAAAGGAAAAGGVLASTTLPTATGTVGGLASGASTAGWAGAAGGTSIYGGAGAAGTAGMSYSDLLRYGLPVAGNLAGSLIQANAASSASDAQQKYLEEALAYQKEQDSYNRGLASTALTVANSRYAGYQDRIAPWIANGASSNDRMASLLGLPARSGGSGGGGSSSSGGSSAGVPVSADITAADLANYKALGLNPTGRGTGATDSAYYDEQIAGTGGLTDANKGYWFGPTGRIATDYTKGGGTLRPGASAPSVVGGSNAAPPITPPVTTGGATAQMKAPDGSVQTVKQADVAHYQSLGATLVSGAA